jgi:hypothetical protein
VGKAIELAGLNSKWESLSFWTARLYLISNLLLMKAQISMTASTDNTEFSEVFRFQVGIFHVFHSL